MDDGVQTRRRTSPRFVWAASSYRPFMSTWAIWSKLCDSNALTATSAKVLLAETGLHGSVFRTRGDDPWLRHATTLSDQQRADACCTTLFHPSAVETTVLRYCHICMERGFHCGCFQHLALTRCPVHDVPLEDRCTKCGAPVSVKFEVARTAVFACRSCESRLVRDRAPRASDPANDAIWRSTIASLSWDRHSVPPRAQRDQTSIEAGCCSWWSGFDPFVAASTWRPKQLVVPAGGDNFNQLAWQALLTLVRAVVDPASLSDVLAIAHSLRRRTPMTSRASGMSRQAWAVACVIAQYGGAAAFDRAWRLSLMSAPEESYWLFTQTSTTVVDSAVGNAVIVTAELRVAYARALQLICHGNVDALPVARIAPSRSRVQWATQPSGENRLLLQWRAPGIHRTVAKALGWRP